MNKIRKRQNDEDILSGLVAQKKLYSKGKKAKFIYQLIFFSMLFVSIITKNTVVEFLITIILFGIELYITSFVSKVIKLASEIQQYIDYKLYKFKINDKVCNGTSIDEIKKKISEINIDYSKYAALQKANDGKSKIKGVKDWYTDIDENLPMNAAILKCQKQNTFWDEILFNKYKNYKIIKFILIIISIILMVVFKEINIAGSLLTLGFFEINELVECKELQKCMDEIKVLENRISNKIETDDLILIQDKIFERRSNTFIIPDILHKIKSKKIHEILKGGEI